jgi:molybdate transport system substrate-binding protein
VRRSSRYLSTALALGLACSCGASPEAQDPLTIFAAASLREVALDLAAAFTREHPSEVAFNFAGSNTLAQQIAAAPGADVFVAAEPSWVDRLEGAHATVPGSRRNVLANRLVLIANRRAELSVAEPRDLATARFRFLALADPEGVPAGRYAKANMERIAVDGGDLWSAVAGRVVPTLDVRAALALVESDDEILGIVYRTDARTSEEVRILYEFPPMPDLPITYCAVALAGGRHPQLAELFVDFLGSAEARAIARNHGFVTAD